MILHVSVNNKVATYQKRDGHIVCGNSDYQIKFSFDREWDAHPTKTARFIWGGQYTDVTFTGDTCDVPIITNTDSVEVGVYAGELRTTTGAVIGCERSILCSAATPSAEADKRYASEAKEAADRAEAAAELAATYIPQDGKDGATPEIMVDNDYKVWVTYDHGENWAFLATLPQGKDGATPMLYISEDDELYVSYDGGKSGEFLTTLRMGPEGPRGPQGANGKDGVSPTISTSKANGVTTITIKDANGTKTATINDGKSAYEYAKEGGYTGTEAQFAELLANSVDNRTLDIAIIDGKLRLMVAGVPTKNAVDLPNGTNSDFVGYFNDKNEIEIEPINDLADGEYTLKFKYKDGTYSDPISVVIGDAPVIPTVDNLLDEAGYADGVKISVSSGGTSTAVGYQTTGFIPIEYTDTLYFKDVIFENTGTNTNYVLYDIDKNRLAGGNWHKEFPSGVNGEVVSKEISSLKPTLPESFTIDSRIRFIRISAILNTNSRVSKTPIT